PRPLPVAVSKGADEASPGGAWLGLTGPEPSRPFGGCGRKEPDLFVCLLASSFSFSPLLAQPAIKSFQPKYSLENEKCSLSVCGMERQLLKEDCGHGHPGAQ
ncbi:hypothetical protein LEMLEM_LOCUS8663, partial [Lemmus lemmus]